MKLTMKMEEESLLLLLELADKYMDKGNIKKADDGINHIEKNLEQKEEPGIKREEKQENKSLGEDADYLLNVLAGEHFYTPDLNEIEKMEIKEEEKSGIHKKDDIEIITTPPVFTQNEIVKLEKAKESINKSKNIKAESEDCEMLLQIMEVYMDIYKP